MQSSEHEVVRVRLLEKQTSQSEFVGGIKNGDIDREQHWPMNKHSELHPLCRSVPRVETTTLCHLFVLVLFKLHSLFLPLLFFFFWPLHELALVLTSFQLLFFCQIFYKFCQECCVRGLCLSVGRLKNPQTNETRWNVRIWAKDQVNMCFGARFVFERFYSHFDNFLMNKNEIKTETTCFLTLK